MIMKRKLKINCLLFDQLPAWECAEKMITMGGVHECSCDEAIRYSNKAAKQPSPLFLFLIIAAANNERRWINWALHKCVCAAALIAAFQPRALIFYIWCLNSQSRVQPFGLLSFEILIAARVKYKKHFRGFSNWKCTCTMEKCFRLNTQLQKKMLLMMPYNGKMLYLSLNILQTYI